MSLKGHGHVHRDVAAACSVICKCQSVNCPRPPPTTVHACVHSLTHWFYRLAPGQACGVGAGDSEKVRPRISLEKSIVQCRSCPPFRAYLKIPMVVGTQAPV